jgi:hypothetical protein
MLNLEEPIFCHPNGRPIGSFKKGFEQALNEAGVLRGSDGKKRVPYSLRHTYATMRISEGVSVFQLAANMGTSVRNDREFLREKANARSEDGNGGNEVQGTLIKRQSYATRCTLRRHCGCSLPEQGAEPLAVPKYEFWM